MFRWLAILTISFALEGCVMVSYWYFRNYTDQPVEISYTYTEFVYRQKPSSAYFHNELLPMKYRTSKKLNDSIPIVYNGSKALLVVPPHSTLQFPVWSFNDTSVILKQAGRTDTVLIHSSSESGNSFRSKGNGIPVVWINYYDFK